MPFAGEGPARLDAVEIEFEVGRNRRIADGRLRLVGRETDGNRNLRLEGPSLASVPLASFRRPLTTFGETFMNRFMFAVVALVFSFSADPAHAQDLQDFEELKEPGFWAVGGVGGGSAGMECSVCATARKPSVSVMAALGGSASNSVKFGIEGLGWVQSDQDTTRQYFAGAAIVQWVPLQKHLLHLQVGIGAGGYGERRNNELVKAFGLNFLVGAGYDIRVNRSWYIRPYVRYLFSNDLSVKKRGLPTLGKLNFSMWYFGVGFGWQSWHF